MGNPMLLMAKDLDVPHTAYVWLAIFVLSALAFWLVSR